MPDATSVQAKVCVGLLEDRAAVLVSPIPRKYPFAAQDRPEPGMAEQLGALYFEVRIQLMVREEDNSTVACLRQDLLQPIDLFVVNRVILIGHIETDERPVLVLVREVAGRLAEPLQRLAEVGLTSGIHLVV